MFIKSDNDEYSVVINPDAYKNHSKNTFFLFGKLIGKAILENITINICFNKLIYLLILEKNIKYEDLVFIDKGLYRSFQNLKKMNNEELNLLELFFEKQDIINDVQITYELVTNGSKLKLDINNLDLYIQSRIEFLVYTQIEFINQIKKGIFSVIPQAYFSNFTTEQFELIINGHPFIDIDDWKEHTIYKGYYSTSHQTIIWFWDILKNMEQSKLERFLQFCTGSSRVPIGGFSQLESNRNQISKFCINYIPYIKGNDKYVIKKFNSLSNIQHNLKNTKEQIDKMRIIRNNSFCFPNNKNYIKSHTCFNRIDLPDYQNKEELEEGINFIVNNEIYGFGID